MSTADRISEIRTTLRDTRIPTRTAKQTLRDRSRPLNQAVQRPFIPAPGQKFVRQRTLERKAKREAKKQKPTSSAPKPKQYANPNDIPIKSSSAVTIKRSGTVEAKPVKQNGAAYEPPNKRRKLDNNQSTESNQANKPMPQSSNTHFYEMIAKDSPLGPLDAAKADELEMAYLEEKLGLKKSSARSKLMNEIKEDGLDDIFSLVNGIEHGMTEEERQRWLDEEGIDDDFPVDEPLSLVQPGEDDADSDASDQLMPEPDADEFASYYPDEDDEDDAENDEDGEDQEDGSDVEQDDEDDSQNAEQMEDGEDDDESTSRDKPSYDEIYGFNAPAPQSLLDFKQGSQPSKSSTYVPPHLRGVKTSSDLALETSITGALNRLTAANIEPLANQLLGYYKSHPPAIVDTALITAAFGSLTSELNIAGVTRSFIQSLAALFELLHITRSESNMGFELIERLTQEIDRRMSELSNDVALDATALPVVGASHLMLLACDLHTFSMIHAPLILDLMRAATVGDTLTAAQTEILVSALKSVGSSLRRSEPLGLKTLMTSISGHSSIDSAVSGRHTYLLALLDDIKHNKQRFVKPDEQVTHTKNWLQNLVKRQHKKDLDDSMIRLTLEDIRSISERGKWWRIGAAWKGKEKDVNAQSANPSATQSTKSTMDADGSIDYRLLARRQGLTSPLHIAIFSTVLSSCDFLECFEKLSVQLTLKPNDWVTVISMVIMLASREAKPNPFYAHLLIHIAEFIPNARFTLQIKFYDFLTNLSSNPADPVALKKQCVNMAHLLAHLLYNTRHGLTLAVLKPIKFTALDLNAMIFLHTLFDVIFTQLNDQIDTIFSRLDGTVSVSDTNKNRDAKRNEIEAVKLGITYFFKKYYQTDEAGKKRMKQATKAMG